MMQMQVMFSKFKSKNQVVDVSVL